MMMLFKNMPSIDLHGMDREYARILVHDFIQDAIKMKEENIIIIHGIGTGVLKRTVHEELRMNKKVVEYKLDNFNPGATIAKIKVD